MSDVLDSPGARQRQVTWPSLSVESALRRLAAVLAGTWLLVETYGVLAAPAGWFRWEPVALGCLGVGLATSVVVAVRRDAPGYVLVVGSGVAALADCLLVQPAPQDGAGFVVYWLPGLVACVAGLLLSERSATSITLSVASCSVAVVMARGLSTGGLAAASVSAAASVCFTLCDGTCALLLARALRRLSAEADAEIARAAAQSRAADAARLEQRVAFRVAAKLHDSVINTLGAIVARGADLERVALRRACARAAATAERLQTGGPEADFEEQIRVALNWNGESRNPQYPIVRLHGMDREALAARLRELPPETAAALVGALQEALTNVTRHSSVSAADVLVTDGKALEICVQDAGVGFSGEVPPGRGLSISVFERCRMVGGEADLVTTPGGGTRVTLRSRPRAAQSQRSTLTVDVEALLTSVRQPFARQFSACLVGLCVGLTLITPLGLATVSAAAALSLVAAVAWVGGGWSRRLEGLRGWQVAVLAAVTIPVVVLPGLGMAGCQRVGTAWWGPDGALIPLTLLVFLGRSWVPTLLGVLGFWTAIGLVAASVPPACGTSAVMAGLLDSVVVVAFVYFKAHLTRLAEQAAAASTDARHAADMAELQRLATRAGRRRLARALEEASHVLREIARGNLDPSDADIRSRCALLEGHLRQLTHLSPGLACLTPEIARCLDRAYTAGVRVVLRLAALDVPTRSAATALAGVLNGVIDECRPGDVVTVVTFAAAQSFAVTATAPYMDVTRLDPSLVEASAVGWNASCSDLVEQILVELDWRGPWNRSDVDRAQTVDHQYPPARTGIVSQSWTTTSSSAIA